MNPMIMVALSDVALIGALVFLLLVFLLLVFIFKWAMNYTRRKYCTHQYHHQEEWDAVCNHCGKNLGYIGTVDRRKMK